MLRQTLLVRFLVALLSAGFLGWVLIFLVGLSAEKIINHDEHQFIASAALIAHHGLMPYLDFPYFHFPGLSFLYAAVFQFTDHLLLAARGLSVLSSWFMLCLLFLLPVVWVRRAARLEGFLIGALVVLLLISTQTFRYTTGWAWNHDVPVLLMVAACCLQIWLLQTQPRRPRWFFLVGLLIGLAGSMRASFVFLTIPFALFLLPLPPQHFSAWRRILWFGGGVLLGLAPAWIFLLFAPAEFIFGNVEYVRLNTQHYYDVGSLEPGQEFVQKFEMTRNMMVTVWRANLALLALTLVQSIRLHRVIRPGRTPGIIFLLLTLPFALMTAYLPTPMQIQYIYLVFPLMALVNIFLFKVDPWPRLGLALLAVAGIYAATQAAEEFRHATRNAFSPSSWLVTSVHEQGRSIARLAGQERVITLAPIYPLEGGATIQAELASGSFSWRVANLVAPPVRSRMGMIGPEEMAQRMAAEAPRALLVGVHGAQAHLEPSLIEFARAQDYVPVALAEGGTLWLSPLAQWQWQTQIWLGAAVVEEASPESPGGAPPARLLSLYFMANEPLPVPVDARLAVRAANGEEIGQGQVNLNQFVHEVWEPGAAWHVPHALLLTETFERGPLELSIMLLESDSGTPLGEAVELTVTPP